MTTIPPYLIQALRCIVPCAWPLACVLLGVLTVKAIDGMLITKLLPVDGFPEGHGGLEAQKKFWIEDVNKTKQDMTHRSYLVWPTIFCAGETVISLWLANGWMLVAFGMFTVIGLVVNFVVKN